MLSFYRAGISPYRGPSCRFIPSCSGYASEAVERYGAWIGFVMALKRLMRCQPLAVGGFDPVP